ncbi:hypothetical protein KSP40_PGU003528 [Platanthera guangdongensis]|uniref:Uncharacterized protein n=1 Tax=Platanthera guangdongensis TaxID=2320717 RepID=A0ABR2LDU4_9ASPA
MDLQMVKESRRYDFYVENSIGKNITDYYRLLRRRPVAYYSSCLAVRILDRAGDMPTAPATRNELQSSGMLSRDQLLHLFSRFSFLTSQPDVKKRIVDAVRDKQGLLFVMRIKENINKVAVFSVSRSPSSLLSPANLPGHSSSLLAPATTSRSFPLLPCTTAHYRFLSCYIGALVITLNPLPNSSELLSRTATHPNLRITKGKSDQSLPKIHACSSSSTTAGLFILYHHQSLLHHPTPLMAGDLKQNPPVLCKISHRK